jgi:hypothetical protein
MGLLSMLDLKMYMNSDIAEVLEWKCCNISGLNLELIFHNTSEDTVPVPNTFYLENGIEQTMVNTVYPPWPQDILPRDYASIYCNMDDALWNSSHSLIIKDQHGAEIRYPINHK